MPDRTEPCDAESGPTAEAVSREETCTSALVRRIAAMLDLAPDGWVDGAVLPRGWHFALLAADTRRSALRGDGFPGLGVPMPDLGLPRLLLGGRTVSFRHDIPIGARVQRTSRVLSVVPKSRPNGSMAVVTVAHELHITSEVQPALVETQTYLLLPARADGEPLRESAPGSAVDATRMKTFVPDETLLFQYSALGFNSHRIHIDRDHARGVEGFPELVVNGGLSTLLLTEFLRRDLAVTPSVIAVRHVAPLYCNRAITLAADRSGDRWLLRAYDDHHRLAVGMEVTVQ